jgi:hypothetical protein
MFVTSMDSSYVLVTSMDSSYVQSTMADEYVPAQDVPVFNCSWYFGSDSAQLKLR